MIIVRSSQAQVISTTFSGLINQDSNMTTYNLHLNQVFPFSTIPEIVQVQSELIQCNDVMLTGIDKADRYNPNNTRLFAIGCEYGIICAVWAGYDQEAFDVACDLNLLDSLISEDQDHTNDSLTPLGNASELFDLTYAWLVEVELESDRDIDLIVDLIKARERQLDNLGDLK